MPAAAVERLGALLDLYGGADVLDRARKLLGDAPVVRGALDELAWLGERLAQQGVAVGFDLADARGWGYYTGFRFAVYVSGTGDALLRGGRYDGVGAAFVGADTEGALRPAAGFTMELKRLADATALEAEPRAIAAPWVVSAELDALIARLRAQGEIVVRLDPTNVGSIRRMRVDRELAQSESGWIVVDQGRAD